MAASVVFSSRSVRVFEYILQRYSFEADNLCIVRLLREDEVYIFVFTTRGERATLRDIACENAAL